MRCKDISHILDYSIPLGEKKAKLHLALLAAKDTGRVLVNLYSQIKEEFDWVLKRLSLADMASHKDQELGVKENNRDSDNSEISHSANGAPAVLRYLGHKNTVEQMNIPRSLGTESFNIMEERNTLIGSVDAVQDEPDVCIYVANDGIKGFLSDCAPDQTTLINKGENYSRNDSVNGGTDIRSALGIFTIESTFGQILVLHRETQHETRALNGTHLPSIGEHLANPYYKLGNEVVFDPGGRGNDVARMAAGASVYTRGVGPGPPFDHVL